MSGQKLYTFPIHPMMFSWSPAAADSSAGVAHQGQCQREFEFFGVPFSFLFLKQVFVLQCLRIILCLAEQGYA